ncbi:MAG: ketoacyl-ACP synthase III, partial [Actinomycetota bacterium]|nr:ketoacyl-ACP synthase III [Actinomycetota bacterium]
MQQPFVVNAAGRLVFPSNFTPDVDFTGMDTLDQLARVIRRDFETKAPSGSDIRAKAEGGKYADRYELLRDLALNLFWVNRFALTMYEARPVRWADVPRRRDDVFLPLVTPWPDGESKVEAVRAAYEALPHRWSEHADAEDGIFRVLFDVWGNRRHRASDLQPVVPTVAEALAEPAALTFRLGSYDPDFPVFGHQRIVDCAEDVPELEALHRWGMVLHDQHPWPRQDVRLTPVAELADDDHVVVLHPRSVEVLRFLARVRYGAAAPVRPAPAEQRQPVRPYAPVDVRSSFRVLPRLEALAAVTGELACTNDDLIRNTAYNWSLMTADQILKTTGIVERRYSQRSLEDLALDASVAALARAGRQPEEIGAVLFCTCTSVRLVPSLASWISGQLGMFQTHFSADIIAACAGMSYGLAEATRLLQEVERPVLLICAEKFSDKIGTVRPSRMIFGDGASAMVVGPAPEGADSDIDVLQTYASGPVREVNSIIWPNPGFGNALTLAGPEVRGMAARYLQQMIAELQALPGMHGGATLLDDVDLIVPHQANKTMVTKIAEEAGVAADKLYFDIDRIGNLSAASIPVAVVDAVRDGVIAEPTRVFAPGFGAGAVGGYAVLRVDPAVVVTDEPGARD